MLSRAHGFSKAALDAGDLGGLLGGGLAYALTAGRHQVPRLGAGLLGWQTGRGLVEGIEGVLHKPDLSGLTEGERKVLQREAREIHDSRNRRRLAAVAAGAGTLLLTGDPLVLMATIPAATIHPYSSESKYMAELAEKYRAARRTEE